MPLGNSQAVLDVLADAIIASDESDRILYANAAAERLLAWPVGELVGQPLTTLMPERMHHAHERGFARYMATHAPRIMGVPVRVPARRRDGTEIDVELTLSEVPGAGGRRLIVASLRDLRERVELERQIVAQQRLSAQGAVMSVFADARSVEAALPRVLAAIGEGLGWAFAEFWELVDGPRLRRTACWTDAALVGSSLCDAPDELLLDDSGGLPATVARERRAAWGVGPAGRSSSARHRVAAQAGLRSAFAFPVVVGDELLGVIELQLRGEPERDVELLGTMQTIGAQIGQFLERMRSVVRLRSAVESAEAARAAAEAAEQRARFLAEAGAVLSSSLDYGATLASVVKLAVAEFAEFAIVDLINEAGHLERVAVAHAQPDKLPLLQELMRRYPPGPDSPQPAARVARSGKPVLLPSVDRDALRAHTIDSKHADLMTALDVRSHMSVPLLAQGRLLGVVSFGRGRGSLPFGAVELQAAEELARRAATAVGSARLYADLQRAERTYRFLAESMPQIVWTARPDGTLDYANRVLADFLGTTQEGALTTRWEEFVHPLDIGMTVDHWQRSIASGENLRVEHRMRRADGVYRWFLVRGQSMRDDHGAVIKWFGTSTDVDDYKLAEARLGEAVEARDEFISIASHELRTPLTSLQLQVDSTLRLLRRDPEAPEERLLPRLENIQRQVGRLGTLVSDLLDVSRASTGGVTLDVNDVDLAALVRETAGRFAGDLASAHCALTLHAEAPLVGRWDARRLDQVATNFLANAIKYGRGHPIEVTVEQRDDRAVLSVRDHGIGIAPADHARIFERFERAVSAEHYGGLGLGLWIARVLVEAMGGTVAVASAPGEGSTFSASLPLDGK